MVDGRPPERRGPRGSAGVSTRLSPHSRGPRLQAVAAAGRPAGLLRGDGIEPTARVVGGDLIGARLVGDVATNHSIWAPLGPLHHDPAALLAGSIRGIDLTLEAARDGDGRLDVAANPTATPATGPDGQRGGVLRLTLVGVVVVVRTSRLLQIGRAHV